MMASQEKNRCSFTAQKNSSSSVSDKLVALSRVTFFMSSPPLDATTALPQPTKTGDSYSYVPYDELESTYFPTALKKDTLCWVLKSKGVKSKSNEVVSQRSELFLRARVVKELNDGRVLVRYPKGSQYRVRRSNLVPGMIEGVIMMSHEVLFVSFLTFASTILSSPRARHV